MGKHSCKRGKIGGVALRAGEHRGSGATDHRNNRDEISATQLQMSNAGRLRE
ncbi:hypothetical protein IC762_26245 [Bradyrhizobium genosp. L]|uniref:hypothetical protein n=1 Tax=Bradyrhizobium genosp. L TaxID=83637 RepID=UPI0018A2ECEA|nr:hypothetical protein [Bradyrhizobium genosp. L]QPF83197.1 hypothetical protein IC762_26245 [Bradyrhizobium genosp. L]